MIFWPGMNHWLKDFRLKDFQPKQLLNLIFIRLILWKTYSE